MAQSTTPTSGSILAVGGKVYTYRTLDEVAELQKLREDLLAEGKDELAERVSEELALTALLIP